MREQATGSSGIVMGRLQGPQPLTDKGSHLPMTETLTRTGAQYLAGLIQAYWSSRGCMPMVRIEPISEYRKLSRDGIIGAAFQVRSDMLNGLPQKIANDIEVRLPD